MTDISLIATKLNRSSSTKLEPNECLKFFRLPGRLDAAQTAALLGFQPHDIPVLVAAKLLRPLGRPASNGQKYFATCELEEFRVNREWLDAASRTINRHWQVKNGTIPKPDADASVARATQLQAANGPKRGSSTD